MGNGPVSPSIDKWGIVMKTEKDTGMHKKLMPCSLLELAGKDRETRHHTGMGVRQSVATLADLYTPRTERAATRRQDRGVRYG
jgi:hypothetical protein